MKFLFTVFAFGLIASSFSAFAGPVTLAPGETVEFVGCPATHYGSVKWSGSGNELIATAECMPKLCDFEGRKSFFINTIVRTSPDYKVLASKFKTKNRYKIFDELKTQGECGELVSREVNVKGPPAL